MHWGSQWNVFLQLKESKKFDYPIIILYIKKEKTVRPIQLLEIQKLGLKATR